MRVIDTSGKIIEALAFSPDSRLLATGGSGRCLEFWEPAGGRAMVFRVSGRVVRFAFHPLLPIAFAVIGPSLWQFHHTRPTSSRVISPLTDRFTLSPDGSRLVVSGRFDLSLNGDRFRMFDFGDDRITGWGVADPSETDGNLHLGLTWLPGTDRFALIEWVGSPHPYYCVISLHDGATGGVVETGVWGGPTIELLTAGVDGSLVAVAKTALAVWRQADLTLPPAVIRNDNRKHFTGIAFHPSGKYLAATSNDETVKLYDTTTWEVARTFTWDIGRMRSIAFSPDGALAAAGSDKGKVVVWDVDM